MYYGGASIEELEDPVVDRARFPPLPDDCDSKVLVFCSFVCLLTLLLSQLIAERVVELYDCNHYQEVLNFARPYLERDTSCKRPQSGCRARDAAAALIVLARSTDLQICRQVGGTAVVIGGPRPPN